MLNTQPIKKRHQSVSFAHVNPLLQHKRNLQFNSKNNIIQQIPKSSRYGRSTSSTQNQKDQLDFSDYKIKNPEKKLQKQNNLIQTISNQDNPDKINQQTINLNQSINLNNQKKNQNNNDQDNPRDITLKSSLQADSIFQVNKISLNYQNIRFRKNYNIKDQIIQSSEINKSSKMQLFPKLKKKQKKQSQTSEGLRVINMLGLRYQQRDDNIIGWEGDNLISDLKRLQITQYLQKEQHKEKIPLISLRLQDQKVLSLRNKYKMPLFSNEKGNSFNKHSKSITLRSSKQI